MTEPIYAAPQGSAAILTRMTLAYTALYPGQDTRPGSLAHAMLAPAAEELASASMITDLTIQRAFVVTAARPWLLMHGNQHGIPVKLATKATGFITVNGTPGTVVPAGTVLSTEAPAGLVSNRFSTDADLTLDANGVGTVGITAALAGSGGSVPVGTITLMLTHVPGVTSISNDLPLTDGEDDEDTEVYRARVLFRLQNPASSGNMADHIAWAMSEPGVGADAVVPVEFGPGTVSNYVITSAGLPAPQALLDRIQLSVAPPWVMAFEAETLTVAEAFGLTTIARNDASGLEALQFVYDPGNPGDGGELRHPNLHTLLPRAGIWEVRISILNVNSLSTMDTFEFGVYNDSQSDWAAATPTGLPGVAHKTLTPAQIGSSFATFSVTFYWNGSDHLHGEFNKINLYDSNSVVVLDTVLYKSLFSKDDGSGKAPIGQQVAYYSAIPVYIEVSARILPIRGFSASAARQDAIDRLAAYVKGQALSLTDKTIRYGEISRRIMLASGVNDYEQLLVNGGIVNIPIGVREVPVFGTASFETWDEFDARNRSWDMYDNLRRTWYNFPGDV
jgi:uncharacterized phage protein gp47/JayE